MTKKIIITSLLSLLIGLLIAFWGNPSPKPLSLPRSQITTPKTSTSPSPAKPPITSESDLEKETDDLEIEDFSKDFEPLKEAVSSF